MDSNAKMNGTPQPRQQMAGTTPPGSNPEETAVDRVPDEAEGAGENVCPACGGSGRTTTSAVCPECGGTGHVTTGIGGG